MKRFCQECGHEANLNDNVCTNCGTKLIKIEHPQQPTHQTKINTPAKHQKAKKPMSKGQKIIITAVGTLAVLLLGLSIWANMYFSKESTEKRFYNAVENQDMGQLENLLMHENGSVATKSEVEAFIELADDLRDDELKDLVSVKEEGKFIGIFQTHKVAAIDQFAYYYSPTDGLQMKFNTLEVKENKDQDGITYGPLLPGIYTVNISLDNDFGHSSTEIQLQLADYNSKKVSMDELPIGEASVYVLNYDRKFMANSYLLVNDKKIEVDDFGDSDYFGPIFLDGSQKVKVVGNYPWGEVESKEFPIDSSYIEVRPSLVSDEELEKIKDTLITFGEETQKAKAQLSTEVFTSATDTLKNDFLSYEINPLINENIFYIGKLNKVDMNADSMWFFNGLLGIHSMFDYSYAFYGANEAPPTLEDFELHSYVGLAYDETSKEWKVSYIEVSNNEAVEPTVTIDGSGTVYEPDHNTVSSMASGGLRSEIQEFVEIYTIASVDAINFGDISWMSPYITSDGPRYKEAESYIAYLNERGITEEFISTEVIDVVDNGNGSYNVTTVEEFIIYYPDSKVQKAFQTVVEVRIENGTWKVHKLISTAEI